QRSGLQAAGPDDRPAKRGQRADKAGSREKPDAGQPSENAQRNFNRSGGSGGGNGFGGGGQGQGGFGGGGFGGRGQGGFGGGGGFGGDGGDRQARMLERFKGMSPDEQKQFIERIKGRGGDTSVFEKAMAPAAQGTKFGTAASSATTIDALFAPLPVIERPGRAWLYVDKQLKSVNMRTGITDGTNTEIVSGELQPGTEVVTGIVLPSAQRAAAG